MRRAEQIDDLRDARRRRQIAAERMRERVRGRLHARQVIGLHLLVEAKARHAERQRADQRAADAEHRARDRRAVRIALAERHRIALRGRLVEAAAARAGKREQHAPRSAHVERIAIALAQISAHRAPRMHSEQAYALVALAHVERGGFARLRAERVEHGHHVLAQLERLAIHHPELEHRGPEHVAAVVEPFDEAEPLERLEHPQQRAHVDARRFADLSERQAARRFAERDERRQRPIDRGHAAIRLIRHVCLVVTALSRACCALLAPRIGRAPIFESYFHYTNEPVKNNRSSLISTSLFTRHSYFSGLTTDLTLRHNRQK
ncbi:transcriptional regulator, IclR family domain protein [Burkholderia mallei]|nr:transcriptional regulator, IclR family domain protein [Burkholderia mallei]